MSPPWSQAPGSCKTGPPPSYQALLVQTIADRLWLGRLRRLESTLTPELLVSYRDLYAWKLDIYSQQNTRELQNILITYYGQNTRNAHASRAAAATILLSRIFPGSSR